MSFETDSWLTELVSEVLLFVIPQKEDAKHVIEEKEKSLEEIITSKWFADVHSFITLEKTKHCCFTLDFGIDDLLKKFRFFVIYFFFMCVVYHIRNENNPMPYQIVEPNVITQGVRVRESEHKLKDYIEGVYPILKYQLR